jgi:acyl dehydratase
MVQFKDVFLGSDKRSYSRATTSQRCVRAGGKPLVNYFLPQIVRVDGIAMGVNYGADRLRFPAPVPVDARVRGGAELLEATPQKDGSIQAKFRVTVEIEDHDKPGCVIDTIARYYPA